MKIKRGDKVAIISGKNRGKTGKVLQVFPNLDKVVVEGVNITIKNTRARRQGEKGQKIEYPAPLHISNVALIDPQTNKPSRVGYRLTERKAGEKAPKIKKVRLSKKSQTVIE